MKKDITLLCVILFFLVTSSHHAIAEEKTLDLPSLGISLPLSAERWKVLPREENQPANAIRLFHTLDAATRKGVQIDIYRAYDDLLVDALLRRNSHMKDMELFTDISNLVRLSKNGGGGKHHEVTNTTKGNVQYYECCEFDVPDSQKANAVTDDDFHFAGWVLRNDNRVFLIHARGKNDAEARKDILKIFSDLKLKK